MLIAKIENNLVTQVADYRELFPNTSFPDSGPNAEFLAENSCLPVTMWKAYDAATEKLESVTPYIEGNEVFTVQVVVLTPEDIAQREEAAKQANKRQAETLLQASDWSQYPDVTNLTNIPHLTNGDAWMFYRLELRSIAINPPVVIDTWPVKPEELWSTTV